MATKPKKKVNPRRKPSATNGANGAKPSVTADEARAVLAAEEQRERETVQADLQEFLKDRGYAIIAYPVILPDGRVGAKPGLAKATPDENEEA